MSDQKIIEAKGEARVDMQKLFRRALENRPEGFRKSYKLKVVKQHADGTTSTVEQDLGSH